MKIAMMIVPLICIVAGFIIYNKKFKIDEKMYEKISAELESRALDAEESAEEAVSTIGAVNSSATE